MWMWGGEAAHVFIDHRHSQLPCPTCSKLCNVRDHTEEREWRHLDLWQCTKWLHARLPRTDCSEHGVLHVDVPWSELGSRFSMMFEGRVILALLASKTVSGASSLMRIMWDEAHGIMTRAVSRGLMRREEVEMPYLAADEKNYGRGGKKFVTILMDLKRGGCSRDGSWSIETQPEKIAEDHEFNPEICSLCHRHGYARSVSDSRQ